MESWLFLMFTVIYVLTIPQGSKYFLCWDFLGVNAQDLQMRARAWQRGLMRGVVLAFVV